MRLARLLVIIASLAIGLVGVSEGTWAAPATDPTAADGGGMMMHVPFMAVSDGETVRYRLGAMVAAVPDLPYAVLQVIDRLTDERDAKRTSYLLAGFAGLLMPAFAAELVFRRLLRPLRVRSHASSPTSAFGRLGLLATRAVLELLALVAFVLVGLVAYFALYPDDELTRRVLGATLFAIAGVRLLSILGRAILAPRRPGLRLPPVGDDDARRLYHWLMVLASLTGAVMVAGSASRASALPEPLLLLTGTILEWLVIAALFLAIWLERRRIARLVGLPEEPPRQAASAGALIAGYWHVLLSAGLLALGLYSTVSRLLTTESQGPRTIATLLVVAACPVLDGLLRIVVRRIVPPPLHTQPATPDAAHAAAVALAENDYAPGVMRNLRIVFTIAAGFLVARIWGFGSGGMMSTSLESRIAHAVFEIATTLVIASAVWGAIRTAINRHVVFDSEEMRLPGEGEGGGTGLSRLQTLLPLLRKFLATALLLIVAMIVISALGVNIGPLLAGAGVVGIAVGFGAQALVRDIVSGIFFLIDDAFRLGEYIDVGVAKGVVERISIRSLRLRHHLGQINTIPFGEIRHVTNFSRDWVIMKLEVRVPLDTDLEKVRKLVKRIGQEMAADTELGANLLMPPKSQGVHRMEETSFVLRIKFMAKPGEQFVLRRELYRRVQEAFRDNGIRIGVGPIVVEGGQSAAAAAAAASTSAGMPMPPA